AGAKGYELTEAGRDLEPTVMANARWGLRWGVTAPEPGDVFRPGGAGLAVQAAYDEDAATGGGETYRVRGGQEVLHARVHAGGVQARHGPAHEPDLVIRVAQDAFIDLVAGRATIAQAAKQGWIDADGSRAALNHCSAIFDRTRLAAPAPAA